MSTRRDTSGLVTGLRRWLASGQLQSPSGAFCAWRDADSGELAFEYPEINGYALTWLAGRRDPTDQETEAEERAAGWLVDRIERGELAARSDWDGNAAYTFDLGMIATGLICHGRRHGDARTQRIGSDLAARLADQAVSPEGLAPILPDGPPSQRAPAWSTAGRAHLAKCVQCLHLIERGDAADALLGELARWERDDGLFLTQPDDDLVMLHPHFYVVEGLWMHGMARDDLPALARARRATESAWRHQLPDGALPRHVALDGSADGPGQCDLTSQAVRAAVLTSADVPGLDRAVDLLDRVSRRIPDGTALPYRPAAGDTHLNSWVTMFGAQALELYGGGSIAWHELV
jgi:hypothetical protein